MARIVVVGMTENLGGVESYLLNFLKSIRPQHDVVFVNIKPDLPLAYEQQIKALGASVFNAEGRYSLAGYLGRPRVALRILRELRADVVYVNALTPNFAYWVKAAQRLGIKAVFHAHSDKAIYSSALKRVVAALIRPRNLAILNHAIQLTASEPAARYMFGRRQHAELVYNAILPERWLFQAAERDRVRKELQLDEHAKVVIVVARMEKVKNFPKILKIFRAMYDQDPTARLLLVGDGSERERILEQISALHLQDVVACLGFRQDIPRLMWASDALLMPSLFEGLPFISIEAQGAGLPVLASEGAVPQVANITGEVYTESLLTSAAVWARQLDAISTTSSAKRAVMNEQIANSPFAMKVYELQIQRVFSFLDEEPI